MYDGLIVAAIMAAAAFIHTVAGFGSALVSMPVLAWVLGVQTAAPLQALLALPLTAQVFLRNRHAFQWREAGPLIAASFAGIPLGVWVLASVAESVVTALLGVLLIVFALFEFFIAPRRLAAAINDDEPKTGTWLGKGVVGFCSGVLGGAYATNGPPLIMYGIWRGWDKALFRSVLQSVFFISGLTVVFWHTLGGLMTRTVLVNVLYGVPGMIAGMLIGARLDNRIAPATFRACVLGLLLVLGISLLLRSGLAGG